MPRGHNQKPTTHCLECGAKLTRKNVMTYRNKGKLHRRGICRLCYNLRQNAYKKTHRSPDNKVPGQRAKTQHCPHCGYDLLKVFFKPGMPHCTICEEELHPTPSVYTCIQLRLELNHDTHEAQKESGR